MKLRIRGRMVAPVRREFVRHSPSTVQHREADLDGIMTLKIGNRLVTYRFARWQTDNASAAGLAETGARTEGTET